MHHSMKREDAAAASERIAQNRRIGHASCRGGPLNLRNASNPIGDEFGSWYRRLEETEEAERQAADLRYRLRRGEERMELLKKLSSRAEKSNKQVHTTKTPAVRRGRSAPEEAEPEKKTKACNSSRQISPHASTRTDPVFSSISSKEESFAKTADTRQPRRAACLFSASCRKREVNRFRQLHSVHVRGSQGEKVVQIDVASLDFLPPACWPEAVETAAAAACIAPSKRRLAAERALDPASWGALAHAASPRKETDLSSPFQAEPPQFLVPWKRWNPRTGEAIPLYSNAVLLQCTFKPTETSARLYR
ncbi:hypothetical protein TGGT1_266035 [Toxoplasma gondii GT1]|uniref:Uncharacterized protein n=12 Tax=Toxoplasma gondii TaxID=5811 RepID=S7UHS1_TOXGG|nr:hypothetical protein TGGT1_266035 [Toxoplasma gondii GT1]KAF4644186.1 hypothetical protein TGRH88_011780 [Toxoplasma gondii]RQX74062.1 hypothetical protein TGCAST_266035 [Toxoplasma gondii CAST]